MTAPELNVEVEGIIDRHGAVRVLEALHGSVASAQPAAGQPAADVDSLIEEVTPAQFLDAFAQVAHEKAHYVSTTPSHGYPDPGLGRIWTRLGNAVGRCAASDDAREDRRLARRLARMLDQQAVTGARFAGI